MPGQSGPLSDASAQNLLHGLAEAQVNAGYTAVISSASRIQARCFRLPSNEFKDLDLIVRVVALLPEG